MFDFIPEFFWKIIITLVGAVFQLVNYTYQVFLFLAETNIFDQSIYHNLTDKVYVILGVVMLFVIAYNILTLVIDPDKNEKGATVEKILKNLVTSFIMIIVCPSIFNFAFRVQNSILTTNGGIITNFFTDSMKDTGGDDTIKAGGRRMAVNTFKAFFVPSNENYGLASKSTNRSYTLPDGSTVNCSSSCTMEQAEKAALELGSFSPFGAFAMNIVKDEVEFNWLIALIAGGYLVYVIVSFCFDLAVRACKLAFYQIIAPIAIACRILPNKEDIFQKWFKAVSKTFLAVFIRIIIMNLGVFLISAFIDSNFFSGCADCSFGVKLIGYAFIILGIVTFIKQAPKLLDEVFGLMDDVSLGIKDKLKDASVFQAGAAAGAGATTMVRNASHAFKNIKDAKGAGGKAAAIGRGLVSTVAGTGSGFVRGFMQGANAGSVKDMTTAAGKGATDATGARDDREARRDRYKAQGKNVITGHLSDMGADIRDWATGGAEEFEAVIKVADQFKKAQDDMNSEAEKVMNKFKNNVNFRANMTSFKGDPSGLLKAYYDQYVAAGASLGAIESDINRLKNVTDTSAMAAELGISTNRSDYGSDADYDAAMSSVSARFAQKVADLDSMYNQLWKQSRMDFQDRAREASQHDASDTAYWSAHTSMYGTSAKDYEATHAKMEEFRVLYESHGAHVDDPITGQDVRVPADTAKNIDDIAGAYGNVGARARSESARVRQQAAARKGDSNK